jgi:TM2 domain-containing membrane protein YozV
MATDKATASPPSTPPRESSPLAALLSYLIPGLGQVYQGRIGKGVLFFACIYTLFFYGMFLGAGTVRAKDVDGVERTFTVASNVYLPSTANSANSRTNFPVLVDLYNHPQFIGQFWVGAAAWPAVWQYVRTDWRTNPDDLEKELQRGDPVLGQFMRTPTNKSINAVHTAGDKRIELGWVFTVIAGVLNIMVIYDAYAGPAYPLPPTTQPNPEKATPS